MSSKMQFTKPNFFRQSKLEFNNFHTLFSLKFQTAQHVKYLGSFSTSSRKQIIRIESFKDPMLSCENIQPVYLKDCRFLYLG